MKFTIEDLDKVKKHFMERLENDERGIQDSIRINMERGLDNNTTRRLTECNAKINEIESNKRQVQDIINYLLSLDDIKNNY